MSMKKRIMAVVAALALFMAVTGYGIVADTQGLSATSQTFACENGGHSGGGC
jgi:hypothetical protein